MFQQYVRALREAKPKYFIYENNKSMSNAIRESISSTFGFEPICINSALVSAQNRQRLYWCGVRQEDGTYAKADIPQPEDRGILLKDVLDGVTDRDKARCVTASVGRTTVREYFMTQQNTMAAEPAGIIGGVKYLTEKEMEYMIRDHQDQRWSFCVKPNEKDKSPCITANIHKGVPYNVVTERVEDE